jgi:SWI/SNF-related matrix-associated actin-dependent regulator 1 of chromatin subfamily A
MQQRPYQTDGTAFLRRAGRAILADEPGLGKTNQLLLAAEGRTLVVSPAALQDVWISDHPDDPGEAQKWRPDLVDEGNLVWTSYHGLRSYTRSAKGAKAPTDRLDPELAEHWDTVIFDESHYLKERNTTWTSAALQLKADRVYLATGTALPNWAHEIFTTLRFLHPEENRNGRKFGSYWRWVGEWFYVTPSFHNERARDIGSLLPGFTWEDFARDGCWLNGKWLRRERDEVLPDLPPLTQQTIRVPMTTRQGEVYRRVQKELYALVQETGTEIVSWSVGGVYAKLLQLATGVEIVDPEYTGLSNKLAMVQELMSQRTSPTVIFTMFRATAERTAVMLRKMGFNVGVISGDYSAAQRKNAAYRFRAGQVDVLVGTFGTMSEGFTFTRADTTIFIERDPRPTKNEQARRRVHRFGQERPCLSIDLVTPKSVDEVMLKLLAEKTDEQMKAMRGFDLVQLLRSQ